MTVFDSRISSSARLVADAARTPNSSVNRVGWVAALVWPAVWTAVVAGSLLGSEGRLLFWAGVVGVLGMFLRQGVKLMARNVRVAGSVIDNAPGSRLERDALAAQAAAGTARFGE